LEAINTEKDDMVPQKTENKISHIPPLKERVFNNKDRKFLFASILFLFFLAALLMLRQLVSGGYFSCLSEDTYNYTSWAWQFKEALTEGVLYPRWLPLNFWGYGSPTFILYPPLAYYLVAFFNIFTGSIITAMNITKFLSLFLSGVGMFFLVREFYTEKIALLTASFCIVFPYTIFQLYFIGTFASTISYMLFAPVILFTYRYMREKRYKDILYAGLCYGGLIMTHLINAYMFTFVLGAFICYMSIVRKEPKDLVLMPLIIMTGLLISSAYIMPVVLEKKFLTMKHFTGEGIGYFYYMKSFILPRAIHTLSPDHLWRVYYNTYVYFVLFFCILIMLFLYQTIRLRRADVLKHIKHVAIFFISVAMCSLLFLFGISRFLWENIPFFEYIQFPARWLHLTVFSLGFLSSVVFFVFDTMYKTKRGRSLYIVVLFLICLLLDSKFIFSAPIVKEQKLMPVKAANLNFEHAPRWVNMDKISRDNPDKRVALSGKGEIEIVVWKSAERILKIRAHEPLDVWLKTFNFPGWKAYLDKNPTDIKTEKDHGAMLIAVPKGRHMLVVSFEDTPVRYYSKIISCISLFVLCIAIAVPKRRRIFSSKEKHYEN
jgi:hypothetical protein